jgi:hypothetical protein
VCKIIAAHAVLGLEMTDHWFNGGAPPQLAFELRETRRPSLSREHEGRRVPDATRTSG